MFFMCSGMNIASRWWEEQGEGMALHPHQFRLSWRSQRAKQYLGINYKAVYQITSPALDVTQNILIMQIIALLFNRSRDATLAYQKSLQHTAVPGDDRQPAEGSQAHTPHPSPMPSHIPAQRTAIYPKF